MHRSFSCVLFVVVVEYYHLCWLSCLLGRPQEFGDIESQLFRPPTSHILLVLMQVTADSIWTFNQKAHGCYTSSKDPRDLVTVQIFALVYLLIWMIFFCARPVSAEETRTLFRFLSFLLKFSPLCCSLLIMVPSAKTYNHSVFSGLSWWRPSSASPWWVSGWVISVP